jgi:hypothetical protein
LEIAKTLAVAAKSFDLDLDISLNGKNVKEIDTTKKLNSKRK